MARIDLTPEEIDYIGRVVQTELGRVGHDRVSTEEYERMVGAVVDTVLNRKASDQFPGAIEDVLNEHRAFSKIAGPARLDPYGTVANAPRATEQTQRVVNEHLAQRAAGKPSIIGGAVNYANRNQSDKSNREGWIDPMIAAGAIHLGNDATGFVHDHGVAPGMFPAPPISVGTPAGFMPPVEPDQIQYGLPNVPTFAPNDRPQPYGPVNWEQDRRGLAVLAPPSGTPFAGLTPEATESLQMFSSARGPQGTSLTSAARSPEENAAALGVPNSEHVKGNAYDISLRGMSDIERANAVEQAVMSGAKTLGTYTTTDPSHVGVLHADFQDRGSPNVHAMVDGSSRNMARAPDWFSKGLSQVSVPTPTPRDAGLAMPSIPSPPPNFAGGMTPRGAPFAPEPSLPAPPSLPPQSVPMPAPAPAPPQMSPMRPDNNAYQGPRGSFMVGGVPSLPPAPPSMPFDALPPQTMQPPSVPPPAMQMPDVQLPDFAPIPTQNPRNGFNDMKRGARMGVGPALLAPGAAQIGRNIRSKSRGDDISLLAGVRDAYRAAGQGIKSKFENFASVPSVPQFSVGQGLAAIQSVMGGGMPPGATAYSISHPGASWSVNADGFAEFTSQHGFEGRAPDGF